MIAELHTEQESIYCYYDQLPKSVVDAFVAIEDKRFYEHDGFDVKSTLKAAYLLFKNDGEIHRGGSTITQQLARNVFLTQTQSYERKIREIFIAIELERKFSKEQIIEFYVNNVFYANSCYGIGAAAKCYFNKDVKELNLAEVAFLCAIPNSPSYYNPLKYPEHTNKRKKTILDEMLSQGFISYKEWLVATNTPIKIRRPKEVFYDYESSYAIYCATRYLMKLDGFNFRYSFDSLDDYKEYSMKYSDTYDESKDRLYSEGYKIKTSYDSKAQKELQSIIDNTLAFNSEKKDGVYSFQGAATVIDNKTGKVIAIVGGRTQKSKGYYTFNRAFQSYRQPGSTIKPLIVYAPALERGYTPKSVVLDTPIEDGPKNAGNSYSGKITLRKAVELSRNVVAWRIMSDLQPETGLRYLQDMHFSKITPQDYYLPAALGGLYYGVSTVEMASSYATLENDGVFREPSCIVSILNADGKEIYHEPESEQVYSKKAARLMTDILEGVVKNGTARSGKLDRGMPAAAKTGTTNDNTLGWFCGYSPYYSIAVTVGYDSLQSVDDLWGSSYPATIWKDMQNYLCKYKKVVEFEHYKDPTKETNNSFNQITVESTVERVTTERNKPSTSTTESTTTTEVTTESTVEVVVPDTETEVTTEEITTTTVTEEPPIVNTTESTTEATIVEEIPSTSDVVEEIPTESTIEEIN